MSEKAPRRLSGDEFDILESTLSSDVVTDAKLQTIVRLGRLAVSELKRRRAAENKPATPQSDELLPELTPKQKSVAILLAGGVTRRSVIAAELGFNPKTYDSHRMAIMHRLGLESEVQLAHLLLSRGAISCGCPAALRDAVPSVFPTLSMMGQHLIDDILVITEQPIGQWRIHSTAGGKLLDGVCEYLAWNTTRDELMKSQKRVATKTAELLKISRRVRQ